MAVNKYTLASLRRWGQGLLDEGSGARLVAYADGIEKQIAPLVAYAAGTMGHAYNGNCPEPHGPDSRDENCPVCAALISLEAAGGASQPAASAEPLFWYRPRSDGGYEGPLHNDSTEDVRKNSGAWIPLFPGAAPVSEEPVAWFVDWPGEPDLGHYLAEAPVDGARSRPLVFRGTAPVAAQAQHAENDVKARWDAYVRTLATQARPLPAGLVPAAPDLEYLRSMTGNEALPALLGAEIAAAVKKALAEQAQQDADRADGARYREFFRAGLPITFLGVDYYDKAGLDAAIDAARKEQA